jgi:zinc transport system substrate-binding protein
MKKIFPLVGFIAVLCTGCTVTPAANDGTLHVSATIYPLKFLAEEIGKEHVTVDLLTPAGMEPHDFEPTPSDVASIRESAVFFRNGGIDSWADHLTSQGVSVRIADLPPIDPLSTGSTNEDGKNTPFDPHFWLDPVRMQTEAAIVRDILMQADPKNADLYRSNELKLSGLLSELHQSFQEGLAACHKKDIVVSHNAFRYLAQRYGFTTIAIAGLSPEEEPSAKRLAEITKIIESKQLKYIFFESLVDPKLSDTIARETGAKTSVLYTIEGLSSQEQQKGETYISLMRKNLQHLRTAMECQ